MRLLAVLLISLLAGPLRAELPGQGNPAFGAALDRWLAGEDAAALAAFSALARDGNTAAQVFLGQIDPLTYLHAHVTAGLERGDRIALLRQEGGLSGRSWLRAAAAADPLARAFLDARDGASWADAIAPLLAAGEIRSLLPVLAGTVNQGDPGAALDALLDDRFRPYTGFLARIAWDMIQFRELPGEPPPAAILDDLRDRVEFGPNRVGEDDRMLVFFRPEELGDDPAGKTDAIATIAARVPALAPLGAVCARLCPDSAARCTMALAFAGTEVGGAAMPTLSPVETLLPSDTYREAPRFAGDLLRLAKVAPRDAAVVPRIDACIARHAAATD